VVLTPRRWRQVGGSDSTGDGDNKPDHREERAISRKTIARGMPDESGVTVVTTLVCFFIFAREAAGASSARHSLRPLNFQMALCLAKLARIARRECGGVFELSATSFPADRDRGSGRHCERKRSNPSHRGRKEWIASSRSLLAKTAETTPPDVTESTCDGHRSRSYWLLNGFARARNQ
jgi:hypothetical protein